MDTEFLVKNAGRLRRAAEIAEHGKQIWMCKGGVHKSPKDYKREHLYVDDNGDQYHV